MTERVEKALELHLRKYNCAQAVACAFAESVGADEQMVFKMLEGFGGGMGNMQGTCGALTGAVAVAGLMNSDGNLDDPKTKGSTYRLTARMVSLFQERVGHLTCGVIKGQIGDGPVLMPCRQCVRIGAEIAEEVLFPAE